MKRLFDVINHQLQYFAKEDMLAAKSDGKWFGWSTLTVKETVDKFSAGLNHLKFGTNGFTAEESDKVAIISNNRPEWLITDMAVQQTGAILVPLYPTTHPSEIVYILNEADVRLIFVSDKVLFDKIVSIKDQIHSIIEIYSFDIIEGCKNWKEIVDFEGDIEKMNLFKSSIPESHIATIIYTSGTTGYPKGVMLSHKNICSCVLYSKESFPFSDAPHNKVLSFLPLNHVFERLVSYIFMYSGLGIYYAENMETIGDNIREIKPNGFTTVPRLLEKVYEKIMTRANDLKGIKRVLFFWALNLGKQYDIRNTSVIYRSQLWLAQKLIFRKWKAALGGNIEFIVTGGAACPVNLLRIFNAAGLPVYEGYGPTENSPVITVNRKAKELNIPGTVGQPIIGIDVKLQEDGEICVKGSTVMVGYYKHPDWTAEVIIDGWLHTGDIGEWVDGKFLKITDRKKELFKTSGGKYIAPQPIENKFKEHSFIEQIMVIGADRKFVSALIVPAFPILKGWLHYKHINIETEEEMVNHPKVLEKYNRIILEINQSFSNVEQIKKFVLLPTEWSIDGGEMTPKLSLKRKIVTSKFNTEIESMYFTG